MYATLVVLALAASPKPAPSSPAMAVAAAALDARTLPPKEARFFRYMWVPSKNVDLENMLVVLGFHCNLLSTQGFVGSVTQVATSVIRIDTRDFGWDKRLLVWEKFRDLDPYFHLKLKFVKDAIIEEVWPGGEHKGKNYERGIYNKTEVKSGQIVSVPAPWLPGKEIEYLRHTLLTEVPILNGEHFFINTARQVGIRQKDEGVGYYEWLGLKNREDFFKLTGTREEEAVALQSEWRAVVEAGKSGISQNNRQIVALGSTSGTVWGTLDVFDQSGRGQAKKNLRRGELVHNAERWYGHLPNRLPATILSDNKGALQAKAPPEVGGDNSTLNVGNDPSVHTNLSCLRCHGVSKDMLRPINDWARRAFKAGGLLRLVDGKKKVELELKSAYLRDLNEILEDDRIIYARAVARSTATKSKPKGLTSAEITKLYGETWNRLVEAKEHPITAADYARELGTWKWKLVEAIRKHATSDKEGRGATDNILAAFIEEPEGTVSRVELEDTYAFAQVLIHGLVIPELEDKVKGEK